MTPEEIQQQLIDSLQRFSEVTTRYNELQEKKYRDELAHNAKEKTNWDASLAEHQDVNKRIAKEAKIRFGLDEANNKNLKKVLDERQEIEKKVLDRAKKQMGEEAFAESQRNKFYKDQLEKYSQGTLAYGGVTTTFKDLTKSQQQELITKAKLQKQLEIEQQKFQQTVQTLARTPTETLKNLPSVSDLASTKLTEFADKSMGAAISVKVLAAVSDLVGAAFTGLAKAAMTMGKSLLSGERGMAVGAKGVAEFTKSIAGAVSALGTLVIGIGGILLALAPVTGGLSAVAGVALIAAGGVAKLGASAEQTAADFNQLAAETNDKLYAGFRELSKMSMTGAEGMSGVIKNLHKMGLTVAEFDKFSKVISNNAKEMKMFGSTAEQGVNKFAEVAGDLYKSEMGKALELMGISAEEQYEHTAKYLALQARLGLTQEKNSIALAKATKQYIEELDAIAAITGVSRKEQEDARNAVMAIDQLRQGLLVEEKRARETGDYTKVEEMKRGIELATTLQAQGATRSATGVAQLIGAGGAVTSTESAEAMQTFGKTLKDIKEGQKSSSEIALQANQELVNRAEQAAEFRRYGASGEGFFAESGAVTGDIAAKQAEYNKQLEAARKKEGEKFDQKKFDDEFVANLKKQREATDQTTADNVEVTRTQMEAAIKLDDAVKKYNDAVGINKYASELFAKTAEKIAALTGLTNKEKPDQTGQTSVYSPYGVWALEHAKKEPQPAPGSQPAPGPQAAPTVQPAPLRPITEIMGAPPAKAATEAAPKTAPAVGPTKARAKEQFGTVQDTVAPSATIDSIFKFTSNSGSKQAFEGLDDRIRNAAVAAATQYKETTGKTIQINSAKRDPDDQERLYEETVRAGRPGIGPTGVKVAKPGTSRHELGLAVDIQNYNDPKAVAAMNAQGLFQKVPNDKVHFEARNGGLFNGPDSGYPVEMHGAEMIAPLNPNSILKKLATTSDTVLKAERPTLPEAPNTQLFSIMQEYQYSNMQVMNVLTDKLDSIINKLENSNDIQDKILKYSIA